MKTTLKRGIGRGASFDGNGRPVLPPAVLAPVTVYRQPVRRRGWRVLGRIVFWIFAGLVMAAAGLAGGAYLFFENQVAEVRATTPDIVEAQKTLDVALPGRPEVALVIGYDKRLGVDAEVTGFRSDTIMLVRADPTLNAVSLLSFPRDLVVDVKCPGREFRGKINSAYGECGARGSLQTVRQLTGLPIHYLVSVNFRGFKQIVARMGGVWLDVDRRYFNDNKQGGDRYATIDLQPGYQKVNGERALQFVRYRHFDSDLFRLARQQMFVKAFKQRLAEFSVTDLPGAVRVITDNVEVGKADKTKVSVESVLSWALFAQGLPSGHVFQVKIDPNSFQGFTDLTTDPANIEAAVDEFANPDVEAPDKATDVALGRKRAGSSGPPPAQVSVTVLNGNGVAGSAGSAAHNLARVGYRIVYPPNGAPANAPSYDYFRTKVYFDRRQAQSQPAARRVARLFGDADVEPVAPEIAPLSNGSMLVVVVGQTFHGTLAPVPRDKTPPKQPPAVRTDPTVAASLLRDAQRKVGFPLLNPTVLEKTSFLPSQTPIRVYSLEGHGAVRTVFATGSSEYWGIQQTSWNDAPILNGPNAKQRIGRRTYELHYNGAKLHMVVLRANGATYWVVNTLLDSLSNETMLAIAKGLKPLPRS